MGIGPPFFVRHMHRRFRDSRGLSLIELVAVMLILGVLAALVAPRWAPGDSTLSAQADRLARELRHAQAMAMARGRTLSFETVSASAYRIADGGATVTDPGGELLNISLTDGVTLSGGNIDFDSLGRPLRGGGLLDAVQRWTLRGTTGAASVTVQPVTGFVSVTP